MTDNPYRAPSTDSSPRAARRQAWWMRGPASSGWGLLVALLIPVAGLLLAMLLPWIAAMRAVFRSP